MNRLIRKFRPAFSGLLNAFKDKSVRIQLVLGTIVVTAGIFLHLSWMEWAVILTLTGLVITAEIFNTAIERLCDFIHPAQNEKIGKIKDYSAAAVLLMSLTAAAAGICILLSHIKG